MAPAGTAPDAILKLMPFAKESRVTTNSMHLSGAVTPQHEPSRFMDGLSHVPLGWPERSTLKTGVNESHICAVAGTVASVRRRKADASMYSFFN